jgi:hypothetical protein
MSGEENPWSCSGRFGGSAPRWQDTRSYLLGEAEAFTRLYVHELRLAQQATAAQPATLSASQTQP